LKRREELLAGSIVLVGIVVGVFGTFWLQGRRFGSVQTEVHVLMRDVGQLSVGNAVTSRGVNIGRVGDISLDEGGAAVRVSLLLEGDGLLADDAVVVIAPESLFGDWQAEIVTRSRFPLYDYYEVPADARLQDGVRVLGGYMLPDLSRLTAVADEVAQNVASLTDRFDRAFGDETTNQISQAIDNMEEFTATLSRFVDEQSDQFIGIAEDVQTSTSEISLVLSTARQSLERIEALLASGDVDSIFVNTRVITAELRGVSGDIAEASQSLSRTLNLADSTFLSLNRITNNLENAEGSLGRLISDTLFASRAESLVEELNLLMEDVRANPRRYVRLSIF
jgi:phospholipid/cholesterol/gamma-HCH transport system substrate-binding protein